MQTVEDTKTCFPLFNEPEYQDLLAKKRELWEEMPSKDKVAETFAWTTTQEYQDLNFKREALTINPAKVCQPLGGALCGMGFEKTMVYIHGSQGCVAYFRTYFNRHFKEPIAYIADSMTEDAAVFGGQKNVHEGLQNATKLYGAKMIAVCTTCIAEVIGDDLGAFIGNARKEGYVDKDFPIPYANTPSFVGSHITGWDNMFEGIVSYFTAGVDEATGQATTKVPATPGSNGKINIVPGFETYLGNYRVIKRYMREMGVGYSFLCDPEEVLDTPANGEYEMYAGGTTIEEVVDAPNAITTFMLQPTSLEKSRKFVEGTWSHEVPKINIPMGVEWTDEFLMKVSEVTGKPIPESLLKERGRLVDMMTDSHAWLHGKKMAVFGDPDFLLGLVKVMLELGIEPTHILCNNSNKRWEKRMKALLESSPYGVHGKVYAGYDLWHMRSLCFTDKPDFIVGSTYGKTIQRDTLHKGPEFEVPLIRIGFPIFDRHHLHRMTTLGYEGGMYLVTTLTNAVLEQLDEKTKFMADTDYNFDIVR
ncbi:MULTISPECIES: nitrogenase molybdenum-iron protein subunit beta [unclassified Uliginosibacterium]|uniref:nitrogenase molybdenum-iron protein subunit beta n=1 Tax=unclassified Uliginosibacterium TaxID=2621521 RepID=UPI000C7D69D6|nr:MULTISPECIES: nitrogenase molybdenum-iron protein subunit beta [unclassified Uliginosibacterium]MDO6388066.1 nitrogenase molybdenum-iron protein subunit beta [Uliginosibacterium sp. 31-12]PLK48202.1 nitrogenase molybdenum-iron protein subunit beta [Uliginosibacterium sp. TH139]